MFDGFLNRRNTVLTALLAAGIVSACLPDRTIAATQYTIQQIPNPPPRDNANPGIGRVWDINSQGAALYWDNGYYGLYDSYVWDGATTKLLPPESYPYIYSVAHQMNSSGSVVGGLWATSAHKAAKWVNGTLVTLDLGSLPEAATNSDAQAIDSAGNIAGISGGHLFTGTPAGVITDRSVLPTYSHQVVAMNDNGQVILHALGDDEGYVWQNGQWTALLDLAGGFGSAPEGINNSGLIVGASYHGQHDPKAVVWQNGVIIRTLELPAGTTTSWAFDINSSGQICGGYGGNYGDVPCMWDSDGTFHDLASLVIGGAIPHFGRCASINDAGQIALLADSSGYILTPTPEPASGSLLLAAAPLLWRRRRSRS